MMQLCGRNKGLRKEWKIMITIKHRKLLLWAQDNAMLVVLYGTLKFLQCNSRYKLVVKHRAKQTIFPTGWNIWTTYGTQFIFNNPTWFSIATNLCHTAEENKPYSEHPGVTKLLADVKPLYSGKGWKTILQGLWPVVLNVSELRPNINTQQGCYNPTQYLTRNGR